ncbi:MAG: DoxX family membrane protein [Rhodobacteraceae bacterium]|nr:DoxX family membrane protein [Paracoccaceae bacterium]
MKALITLHNRIFDALESLALVLIPTLARLVFAGTLLVYYWNSGLTKLGEGWPGILNPGVGAYGQIVPRLFEQAGYNTANLGLVADVMVRAGTWAEFILPALLLLGLATRLAALGMIGFVIAQSWVDIHGHNLAAGDIGAWFDRVPDSLIADQRAFWMFLLVVIVLRGAGPLSADAILRRTRAAGAAGWPKA